MLKDKAKHTETILRPHHPHQKNVQHHHNRALDTGRRWGLQQSSLSMPVGIVIKLGIIRLYLRTSVNCLLHYSSKIEF